MEGVFILNADGELFNVKVTFPRKAPNPATPHSNTVTNTVIQGELVTDVDHGNPIPRFLIIDCLVFDGHVIHQTLPLSKRLLTVQTELINPRNANPQVTTADTFRVRLKTFVNQQYFEQ
ncbi:hypothetical protein HK101_006190 [Irineochytrium annulatum]|nr:hypothetical protein HK101_006190 [Irineochytrium annulatum]